MNKTKQKYVLALYVTLYLFIVLNVSSIQISQNASTAYTLNIEYESHRCTAPGGLNAFVHSYTPIVVVASVMADNYESTLSSMRVSIYPLWVDTSNWAVGDSVSISGSTYVISDETNQRWKAHRSFGDDGDYINLYYNKEVGIFVGSYSDFMSLDPNSIGFRGYTVDIELQHSNIDGLVAKIYGTNVIGLVLLISGIFIEIPIIVWLQNRRSKLKLT